MTAEKQAYLCKCLPVFILLTLALAVRVYLFGQVPGGVNQDEAMAAYDAYALSLYGTDRFGMFMPVHFTAWGYGQMSVLLSYAMVPFIKIFGFSAVAARLPMLLASMAGLYALYGFTKDAFGYKAAVTVLAFAAINPWHIIQARWALDCNMFPHMLMIAVWLLHKGLSRTRYLYLSMLFFALCMYAYGIAFYTVPILLIILCVFLVYRKMVTFKQALCCAGVYVVFAWPLFAVMLINYFQWPALRTPFFTVPYFPQSVRVNDLLIFSPDKFDRLKQNFIALINVVLLQHKDLPWNKVPDTGAMYRFFQPFAALGLAGCVITSGKKKIPPGAAMLLCWLMVALLSGLMVNNVNINRINIIYYPLMMLTGLGIYNIAVFIFRRMTTRYVFFAYVTALLITYSVSFLSFSHTYFNEHNRYLSRLFYADFFECLTYAQEQEPDRWYITAWTQYPGSANVSEILTLYGLAVDPVLFQYKDAYRNQYRYTSFEAIPAPEKGAVYIFNMAEAAYFPADLYEINYFEGFGIARILE